MAVEIERKFLLKNNGWKSEVSHSECYRQGYMSQDGQLNSVRVRTTKDKAWINFKSATLGMRRLEFEYSIPIEDALQMLDQLCYQPILEKERYFVSFGQHTWEIDVFHAENSGLVVAEIELKTEIESFARPSWLGAEVTDDKRYYNVCLLRHPFKEWDQ